MIYLSDNKSAEALSNNTQPPYSNDLLTIQDNVATINIIGPIARYGFVFVSIEAIHAAITLVDGMGLDYVLFTHHSGGGSADGIWELSDRIFEMKTPTISYVESYSASASLLLATSTNELYIGQGATLGSVGVVSRVANKMDGEAKTYVSSNAKRKIEGPNDKDFDESMQDRVDELHQLFIEKLNRNLSNTNEDFQDGKMFNQNESIILFNAKIGKPEMTIKKEEVIEVKKEEVSKEEVSKEEVSKEQIINDERARVQAINEIALVGCETIISQAIADGSTVEATMRLIILNEKTIKTIECQKVEADVKTPVISDLKTSSDEFMSAEIETAFNEYKTNARWSDK